MSSVYPTIDPQGLLEYSVVFNDRSLNHMSRVFQGIMRDLARTLKDVYGAHAVAIVPGGGTVGMEAIARQFATDQRCLVIRNGFFSYRWSQILAQGRIAAQEEVLKAKPVHAESEAPYAPPALETVIQTITRSKPQMVFAAHVETASGLMLPESYIKALADATHAAGGLFVLDCVASGAMWIDMRETGVDVLLSAPQKGWGASPCAALVLFSPLALHRLESTTSSSFAIDLKKWRQIMQAYEDGGHAYHATMPTDALARFHAATEEMKRIGFASLKERQQVLGRKVREGLKARGYPSVAAPGFEAPGVVVSYTRDSEIVSRLIAQGLQAAAGVPLMVDERPDFKTFRLGLFGLDKLEHIDRTVDALLQRLDAIQG